MSMGMGHAYQWMTSKERNNIYVLNIRCSEKSFIISVNCRSRWLMFEYEQFQVITSVRSRKEEISLDGDVFDVFREDLSLIILNQKAIIHEIKVSHHTQQDRVEDPNLLAKVYDKIYKQLLVLLAARSNLLSAKRVFLAGAKPNLMTSLLPLLDSVALERLSLNGFQDPRTIKDSITLFYWNANKSLDVTILDGKLNIQNLLFGDQTILLPSLFRVIKISYAKQEQGAQLNRLNFNDWGFELEKLDEPIFRSIQLFAKTPVAVENEVPTKEILSEEQLTVLKTPVILSAILNHLNFFDSEKLRKVCRGIRSCIDSIDNNPKIEEYTLSMVINDGLILSEGIVLGNGETSYFHAVQEKNGCSFKGYTFENIDYRSMILNDFESNLKHRKTILEKLELEFYVYNHDDGINIKKSDEWEQQMLMKLDDSAYDFLQMLRAVLRRRRSLLKVKKIVMRGITHRHIMLILPYLDPESVQSIYWSMGTQYCGSKLELDEISKTEQWKSARTLDVRGTAIATSICQINFDGFSNVCMCAETITNEDVHYLKTEVLESHQFLKFEIKFKCSTVDDTLHTLIGEPYRNISDSRKIWFFRFSNTDEYLHIVLNTNGSILLNRVKAEDTPFFN